MRKEIILKNKNIAYKVKLSKKAQNARITMHLNGELIVTIPFFRGENAAQDFLFEKADWVLKNLEKFKNLKDKVILKNDKLTYKKNKEKARQIISQRVAYNNKIYNFNFNKIFIRNQRRQWGSCSEKGNLNFNFKLLYLPQHLLDYIVVHELCHLKELNHSKKFWDLVKITTPNHKELRGELKKYI
jgi:predicted metal-dependent hydrolase